MFWMPAWVKRLLPLPRPSGRTLQGCLNSRGACLRHRLSCLNQASLKIQMNPMIPANLKIRVNQTILKIRDLTDRSHRMKKAILLNCPMKTLNLNPGLNRNRRRVKTWGRNSNSCETCFRDCRASWVLHRYPRFRELPGKKRNRVWTWVPLPWALQP